MDNAGQGTTVAVTFDLNGPDAERVVKTIMSRVQSGYGIKLSVSNGKILAQVLYHQAMQIQTLQGKCRSLEEQLYPPRLLDGATTQEVKQGWWNRGR